MYKIFDALNGSRLTREYAQAARAHGVTGINVTVNNFSTIRPYPSLEEALSELVALRRQIDGLSDDVHLVEHWNDFPEAEKAGKLAITLGFQNVPGIGRNLQMLDAFRDLGVRIIQIAHNFRGAYADGCAEPANGGLSVLGRELVHKLNELGILIDLSHTGERSTIEACELSTKPVALTHANAFAVCANSRNKSDDVLDALKKNDGIIGICYLPPMISLASAQAGHEQVAAHVHHVRQRIGVRHIGIGSDFIEDQPAERYQEFLRRPDLYGTWPWRFPVTDLADQQRFLGSLNESGYTRQEVEAIARTNFHRVFEQVLN